MSDIEDEDDEIEGAVDEDEKDEETLALEAEFEKVLEKASAAIDAELAEAQKHLDKAVKLSEKYGVPFHTGISPLGNTYTPDSFQEKFGGLDSDFVYDTTGTYDSENYQYGGWQHSAVC